MEKEIAAAAEPRPRPRPRREDRELRRRGSDRRRRPRSAMPTGWRQRWPSPTPRGCCRCRSSGQIVRGFGDNDGLGGQTRGHLDRHPARRPGFVPADGWVVYAGPFRSYGQLLIINAGDGYHVLLAGMERDRCPARPVRPRRRASRDDGFTETWRVPVPADIVSTQPVLYIEFRKDGTSIDPAPWWAASSDEKVGG